MLQLLMKAIKLNNRAVKQLEGGDLDGAQNLLGAALRILKTLPTIPSKARRSQPKSTLTKFSWSEEAPVLHQEDGNIFVFRRGMFIHTCTDKSASSVDGDELAVLLFNAALVSHLLALDSSDSSHLKRSYGMYRAARSVLGKRHVAGVKSQLCHKQYFHVALLNNLGQVSFELVDFEGGKQYFDQLYRNLKLIMTRKDHNRVYRPTDLNGMMSNSLVEAPTAAACA